MSVGYIAASKELKPVTFQPLLLVEISFQDPNSTVLRLCSHALETLDGGVQWNGNNYLPRILNDNNATAQLLSDDGVDTPPSVSIDINDADGYIWTDFYPLVFKGATLVLRFILWNVGVNDFSTDSVVKLVGICDTPSLDDTTLTVTTVSKLNMTQTMLPPIRLQPTCPWTFPNSPSAQQAAADAQDTWDSPSFECSYAPAATGGNAVGNYLFSTTLSTNVLATAASVALALDSLSVAQAPPYALIVDPGNSSREVMYVQSTSLYVYTVVRGMDGTIATSHSSGAAVQAVYTTCALTRADCMKRLGNASATSVAPDGDITHDTSARHTGNFGGSQWQPPKNVVVRNFSTQKWQDIIDNQNVAKYNGLIPLNYGTVWTTPLVLNLVGDGNFTKMEVLCGYGQIQWIYQVIVNGVAIPHTYNDAIMSQVPPGVTNASDATAVGWWVAINDGRRHGALNADADYNNLGDPYGSLAVIEIVVVQAIATTQSAPQIQVMLDGPAIRVYTAPTTFSLSFTSNPFWHLFDVLKWAQWTPADIGTASFIASAALADTQIDYTSIAGNVTNTIENVRSGGQISYAKFASSFALSTRTSAAECVRGLRNGCQGLLAPNYFDGTLQAGLKQTLADQQPSPVQLNGQNASNFNTAIASFHADGTAGTGYSAYDFDESSIVQRNGKSTLKILERQIAQMPNRVSVPFMDAENQYSLDSDTIIDTEDVQLINQNIVGNLPIIGPNTFDRVMRVANAYLAENMRGNPRLSANGQVIGDTGGTIQAEFETSFIGIHLNLGNIIRLSWQKLGISLWQFRIQKVQMMMNARTIKITATYHNDLWYLTAFGQQNAPLFGAAWRTVGLLPPNAWQPALTTVLSGDAMIPQNTGMFTLAQTYDVGADGSALCAVEIAGYLPTNAPPLTPAPPQLQMQATTANTGGTIPGGFTYYIAVSSSVTSGVFSPAVPSLLAKVYVPSGSTNTVTVAIPYWPVAAVNGYTIYMGQTVSQLTSQATATTNPSAITLTSYDPSGWPIPDPNFYKLRVYTKRARHLGTLAAQCAIAPTSSSVITLALLTGTAFTTNQFAGAILSLLATASAASPQAASDGAIAPFNARIASNAGDTIAFGAGLDGNVPNALTFPRNDGMGSTGFIPGDLFVVRLKPTYGSDSGGYYLTDPNWVNVLNALAAPVSITAISNANPGAVTTSGAHGLTTGDLTYLQGTSMTGFPALFTATVIDSTHFTLGVNTTGAGTYAGGATSSMMVQGLAPSAEKNNILRYLAGTGEGNTVQISDNTSTKIWILGDWPVTPDASTIFVIEEATWQPAYDSQSFSNATNSAQALLIQDLPNFAGQPMITMVATVNPAGQESIAALNPVRDYYLFGGAGTIGYTGAVSMTVTGTLGIGSNLAPLAFLNKTATALAVIARVKVAPTGAGITININLAGSLWMSLTILAGTTEIDATSGQLAAAVDLTAGASVTLDITGVGTSFPGSDLSVVAFI